MPREAQRTVEPGSFCPDVKPSADREVRDDLSRPVYGVLGVPLDVIELGVLLQRIDEAVTDRAPFLLSTPNVNFLMMARADEDFRESLLVSDLCPADGMPLVWIARLLGVPIRWRVSGSDIFAALRARRDRQLKVFMFGGAGNIADAVGKSINAEQGGMLCVGALNPGFGSVAELSSSANIREINATSADLLTVFLSARKAQSWLLQNHHRIEVPFRAQFGATINLQAGVVKRAPLFVQRMGFEWLWRVKEEPYLCGRYLIDGCGLCYAFLTQVLPLSTEQMWRWLTRRNERESLTINQSEDAEVIAIELSGAAIARHIDAAMTCFRSALAARKTIVIDISQISTIDPRFFGLLLMVRKQQINRGRRLVISGAMRRTKRIFKMNGFEFLLGPER